MRSQKLRSLLLPLLCSLVLVGCTPPGPYKPAPTPNPAPAPAPTPEPAPAPQPNPGPQDEVFDETLVTDIVNSFAGIADGQTKAKDYAAIYLAAERVVGADKSIKDKATVVAHVAAVRELQGLIQGGVPELAKIVGRETDKIADGDLTDKTRSQFVTLFHHLYEGCRRAASK